MWLRGRASVYGAMGCWIDPRSSQWCNRGRGVCDPVSRMVHIKKSLLVIEKSSQCNGDSRFIL